MRHAAAASIGLVVVVALSVTGCVAERTVPPGPTADELDAYYSQRVDDAWVNTGLEGIVERPVIEIAGLDGDGGSSGDLALCIQERGYDTFGFSDGPQGVEFVSVDGSELTAQMKLDFFSCFAGSPARFNASEAMLSRAQLEFLYDYYQEWVLPCFAAFGVGAAGTPSREAYLAEPFATWTPYSMYAGGSLSQDELIARCGEPHAGIIAERVPGGFSMNILEN